MTNIWKYTITKDGAKYTKRINIDEEWEILIRNKKVIHAIVHNYNTNKKYELQEKYYTQLIKKITE